MGNDTEYLTKFIVKQIVDAVGYNPQTDEYEINRIHISDELLEIIEKEGGKYGLKPEETRQLYNVVANNIKTAPIVKCDYGCIELQKLKIGQHLRILFLDPNTGKQSIEALYLGNNSFYVLSSSVYGVIYRDELVSQNNSWNNSYDIDFLLYRNKERFPTNDDLLRIGKLICVEFMNPSYVHEILDDDKSFMKEELVPIREFHL